MKVYAAFWRKKYLESEKANKRKEKIKFKIKICRNKKMRHKV